MKLLPSTCYQIACTWEVLARKVGNVHRTADFAGTTLHDFLLSAIVSTDDISNVQTPSVGASILQAAMHTHRAVKQNTNLGILLLIAPLACIPVHVPLRSELEKTLASLTNDDARAVYRAIRLMNPGGLGSVEDQDANTEPTVTLLEAMKLAADRDLIARQYAANYVDLFDFGVPHLLAAYERLGSIEAAIVDHQFRWLAEHPDSLIARKCGAAMADGVRSMARRVLELGGLETAAGRTAGVELDRFLRADGHRRNPGTTADLIAGCLFIALREGKLSPAAPFAWDVPDWL